MVSPLVKLGRTGIAERRRKSPMTSTLISPNSTQSAESPSKAISPARRMLFRHDTDRASANASVESREQSEVEQLKMQNQRKDTQLRVMHERFHHIQKGLGTIDDERVSLVEKAKRLEKEKRVIEKQLEIREKEILTLVKRCADQEEKMREYGRVRSQNRQLAEALDAVRSKLADTDKEQDSLNALRKKLQESELAREDLQDRLLKVQREHDMIAETLQECLGNIRTLTDEKQQIEEERRRERKRAEIELEKQRLAHIQVSNTLKDNIETQQARIHQMEQILQDNMLSNTSLRRQNALMSKEQQNEIDSVVEKYEVKLAELREQVGRPGKVQEHEYKKELALMKKELDAREAMLRELETQFSQQMEALMTKQVLLDEVTEEKLDLEQQLSALQNVGFEHEALVDFVGILDSNLAELTNENAHLILEKDTLGEEVEKLQIKTDKMKEQLSRMQANRRAREEDFRELLKAEKDELKAELETELFQSREEVNSLKAELESREKWITKVEFELRDSKRDAVHKEETLREIMAERDEMQATMQISLNEANRERESQEEELMRLQQELESTEEVLLIERKARTDDACKLSTLEKQRNRLESRQSELSRQLLAASQDREIRDCESTIDSGGDARLQKDLELQLEEAERTAGGLKQDLVQLSGENSALKQELAVAKESIEERDSRVQYLEDCRSRDKESILRSEVAIPQMTEELESFKEKVDFLEKANASLEIEVEASRVNLERENQLRESLEEEHKKQEEAHSRMHHHTERLEGTITSLRKELETITKRCLVLEQETKRAKDAIAERTTTIADIEEKLAASEAARDAADQRMERVTEKITELEDKVRGKDMINLQNRLSDAERSLSEHMEMVRSLESQRAEALELQEEAEESYSQAQLRIARLEEELAARSSEVNSLNTQVERCNRDLALKDNRIKSLQEQNKLQDQQWTLCQKNVEEKVHNLEAVSKRLEETADECNDLRNQLDNERDKASNSEQKAESLQKALSGKELNCQKLETSLASFKKRTRMLEDKLTETEVSSEGLSEELREAQLILQQNEGTLDELEDRLSRKDKAISELEMEVAQRDEGLTEKQQQLSEASSRIISLEKEVSIHVTRYSKLADELDETTQKLERQMANTDWIDTKIALESQLTCTKTELSARDIQLNSLQSELTDNKKLLTELRRAMKDANKTISQLRMDKSESDARCVSLEHQISVSKDEFENKYQELNSAYQTTVESLQSKDQLLKDFEVKVQESEEERRAIQRSADDMRATHEATVECLQVKDELVRELEGKAQKHEEAHGSMQRSLDDAHEEIVLLEQELGRRDTQIHQLQSELEQVSSSKDELLAESEQKRETAEALLSHAQTEVASLSEKLESRDKSLSETEEKLAVLSSQISENHETVELSKKKFSEMESEVSNLNGLLEARERHILKTDEELHTAKKKVAEQKTEIRSLQSLKAVLQASLDEAHANVASLRETLTLNESKLNAATSEVQSRDEEFTAVKNDLVESQHELEKMRSEVAALQDKASSEGRVVNEYRDKLEAQETLISSLQKDIKDQEQVLKSLRQDQANKNASFEREKREIEAELDRRDDKIRELQLAEPKQEQTEMIDSLQAKVLEQQELLNLQLKESQNKEDEFEQQKRYMETELALKDDEIRELRLVELKDAEDTIAALTQDIEDLTLESAEKEENVKHTLQQLKAANAALKANEGAALDSAEQRTKQYEKRIESLELDIKNLKSSKASLEVRLNEQDSRLQERHDSIASLTKKKNYLQDQEHALREERDSLLARERKANEEIEKLEKALDVAIIREREDSDIKIKQKESDHNKELLEINGKVRSSEKRLSELGDVLSERSTLLTEMVERNKILESKAEQQALQLARFKEEASRGRSEVFALKKALSKTQDELRDKEKTLVSKLREETRGREAAEKASETFQAQYNEAVKINKNVAELEKENASLRDKISRQEAYLERKLKKEKVLRDRLTPAVKSPTNTPQKKKSSPSLTRATPAKVPHRTIGINPVTSPAASVVSSSEVKNPRSRIPRLGG